MQNGKNLTVLANELGAYGNDWHQAGTFKPWVLNYFADLLSKTEPGPSMETGTGKSTILFSNWSTHHRVFTIDDTNNGNSYLKVKNSPLLKGEKTEFILGPSQITLPGYKFSEPLKLAMLDGPHGFPFPFLEYYHVYPHLLEGALLIIDDIHIPVVHWLFEFLSEDPMFELLGVAGTTAIFRRTSAPLFDPLCDGWFEQAYNVRRFPNYRGARGLTAKERFLGLFPMKLKQNIKNLIGNKDKGS